MAAAPSKFRFSVIIPLEFHRGQALECAHGWTRDQTFPRDQFEILFAVPPAFSKTERLAIEAMLSPWDRLMPSNQRHDMALCAEAAAVARGETLFFTESHCLPENDTLALAAEFLDANPDLAGFSCRSVPVTHNLLSEVEAELYDKDIRHAMAEHPWRKILDQCFVVRRWAYLRAGGFDAQLGHFAEWLLAACMYRKGLKVGYAPHIRVRHYYIGQWREWREFTEDFSEGQMRYLASDPPHECRHMFEEIPEWAQRDRARRGFAGRILVMLARDLMIRLREANGLQEKWIELQRWNWRDLGHWTWRALAGSWSLILPAQWRSLRARVALQWHLLRKDKAAAQRSITECCEAMITRTRARFLRRHSRGASNEPVSSLSHGADSPGFWLPASLPPEAAAGFHLLEGAAADSFRWSEPAAIVELRTGRGRQKIALDWHAAAARGPDSRWRFFLDERIIPAERVRLRGHRVELKLKPGKNGIIRIGWVCAALYAPGDARRLGLALREITWNPSKEQPPPAVPPATCTSPEVKRPLFFLHIRKTAGASLRDLLENRFRAGTQLHWAHAPKFRDTVPDRFAFVTGHLSFGYLRRFTTRPLVFTVLREPVERALSAYHFFKRHNEDKFRDLQQELSPEAIASRREFRDVARRMSLLDFLRKEPGLARPHLANIQTRCLLTHDCPSEIDLAELEEAKHNLNSCEVVGLTERLPETLALLEHATGWRGLGPLAHENRTPDRPPRIREDPRALEILRGWNDCDARLYAEAVRIFECRMEKLPREETSNESVDATNLPLARNYVFSEAIPGWGWYLRERDSDGSSFCWTGADNFAWIDLRLDLVCASVLRCRVRESAGIRADEALRITVNSQLVPHRWLVSSGARIIEAPVPRHVIALRAPIVRIGFELGGMIRPRDSDPGHSDKRRLCLAFSGISIDPA